MIKILRFYLLVTSLLVFSAVGAYAQNCTVNAGQDRVICPGTPFILTGTATGLFANANKAVWTQVAGPAVTISTTDVVAGEAKATVTGFVNDVNYTFRLVAKCVDGSPIFDDAIYKSSKLTVVNLGPDRIVCPGQITLIGTPLQSGETALWESITGDLTVASQTPAGVATVNVPADKAGVTTFRYTISGGGCTSTALIKVTNLGGVLPVTATSPYNLGCYTTTTSQKLNGSFGGIGSGQIGTWSFISGPNTPVFSDPNKNDATVSNLIEGVYKLRWTVAGQCSTGTADVTINVGPASQSVTDAGGATLTYCDARTSTVLNGTKPLYNGETVTWVQTSGAATTITGANTFNPTITGLDGSSNNYTFKYTITNSFGCTSEGEYKIRYTIAPNITFTTPSPQILACNTTTVEIGYTTAGGNKTEWALISGPSNSAIAIDNPYNVYRNASSSPQKFIGLDKIGTYVIRFKRTSDNSSGGCSDSYADMTISVSKAPYTAVAGTPQFLVCGVLTATLAGNNAQAGDSGVGQWSQVSGPNAATITNKNSSTTSLSNLQTGVYTFRWIVSGGEGDCDNTQSDVKVIVGALPTIVNAGTTINACFGTPIKLDGNIPLPGETGTWTVVSESPVAPSSTISFSNVNDPKAIATGFLANKTYVLKWTISNACGTINDNVTISTDASNGPKQAVAGANQCFGSTTTSFNLSGNAAGTGETGTWRLLQGPNSPTFNPATANAAVSGAVVGTYAFEWKLERGSCTPTLDTVAITIAPTTTIAVVTGAPLQSVCATAPINSFALSLIANAPAGNEIGTWTQIEGPGGAVINNPNSFNTANVTGLIAARYKFRWTISNNSCSSSFADITYNIGEPPSTAVAGSVQNLCDVTSTTLAATAATVGTGSWTVVSGPSTPTFGAVNSPTSSLGNLKLGVYVLKWTVTNGSFCAASTDNVTITVSQSAKAGADQNLCNVTTTSLIGNEGSKGTWSLVSKPIAAANPTITPNTPANNSAIVTGLEDGEYKFKYTITSGGCGTADDEVTVTVSTPPSDANAGPDKELCTSPVTNSVTLTAVQPLSGTGVWSIISQPTGASAVIATANTNETAVNNLTVPGVYILQYRVSKDNCSGTQSNNDIVRITVYAIPTTVLAMPEQDKACKDGVILTGTTPLIGIGTWTHVSGGGATVPVITAINSPTTTVTNLVVGNSYTFRWTISNGTCTSSSQDVSITVVDVSPEISAAGIDKEVCTNAIGGTASQVLNATPALGGSTGTWTITGPGTPTFAIPTSATTTVSNLVKGTYTLKWTISNSSTCTTEDTMIITVFDPPSTANIANPTASYCLYSPVQLAATVPTSGIGTWTVVSKPSGVVSDPVFSNVNAANASVNGLELGNYTFRWTTSNGPCTTSQADVVVTIEDCQVAIAKSASTPVPQSDGTYNVTFTFKVRNTGTTALNNVQVEDQLNLTFPSPKVFSVAANAVSTNNAVLTRNPAFNGVSDQNLLVANSSTLAVGQEVIITLIVNVKL